MNDGAADAQAASDAGADVDPATPCGGALIELSFADWAEEPGTPLQAELTLTNCTSTTVDIVGAQLDGGGEPTLWLNGVDTATAPDALDDPDQDGRPGLMAQGAVTLHLQIPPTDVAVRGRVTIRVNAPMLERSEAVSVDFSHLP